MNGIIGTGTPGDPWRKLVEHWFLQLETTSSLGIESWSVQGSEDSYEAAFYHLVDLMLNQGRNGSLYRLAETDVGGRCSEFLVFKLKDLV
jgi:hypothetical protein